MDLNRFCKYERELSHEDALAITRETFLHLSSTSPHFRDNSTRVPIPDTAAWEVYYDACVTPAKAAASTLDWFSKEFAAGIDTSVIAESQRFALGDSIVLNITSSAEESIDVDLALVDTPAFDVPEDDQVIWQDLERELKAQIENDANPQRRADRQKASPVGLRMPLSNFPVARIDYAKVHYSRARSFQAYLENTDSGWAHFARQEVGLTPDAPRRPGLLAIHMVVLMQDADGKPYALLAQRSKRQGKVVGFHLGKWSASLEEQFEVEDGRLSTAITRGLREEIFAGAADDVTFKIAALFLERRFLNLSVAVVRKTVLSFDEIHKLWSGCVDRDEHSQIVGLPLTADIVKGCIEAGAITEEVKAQCVIEHSSRQIWQKTGAWALHPTSAFRLALALRAAEG